MDRKFQLSLQQITRLRQELAALDERACKALQRNKRSSPSGLSISVLRLKRSKTKSGWTNQKTAALINELRQKIITSLEQFNQWQKAMREMEKLFLVNFVRPGFILKQAVRQREYLEAALIRLRTRIINHEFQSLSDLDNEIRSVLSHSDHGFVADQRSFEDEEVQTESFWKMIQELDPQPLVEGVSEDQIEREFRKIVLPAVHPDTSDTPVDTFLTVKTVYEQNDTLLMEAYVAKYRGEITLDENADLRETREMLEEQERQYQSLAERLDRRLNALKKELTVAELEDPEKVKELLHEQRDEIKKLIQVETEKVFDLRSRIMDLIKLYQDLPKEKLVPETD